MHCLRIGFTLVIKEHVYHCDLFNSEDKVLYVAGFGKERVLAGPVIDKEYYDAIYDIETKKFSKMTIGFIRFMDRWNSDFVAAFPNWSLWEIRFSAENYWTTDFDEFSKVFEFQDLS